MKRKEENLWRNNMSRVLVIPDIHEPCSKPGAIQFCKEIKRKYRCNEVVFIGDIVDSHAVSFHAAHPEMPGPKDEFDLAHNKIQDWKKAFPVAKIVLGNHDRRIIRLAESVKIPSKYLRNFKDVWNTPKWTWEHEYVIDNVLYIHGEGTGASMYPAYNKMKSMGMSCVLGHFHKAAGIKWLVNPLRRMFGMDVGALISDSSMAFAYAKYQTAKSVLGVGVVLEGIPYYEILPCSEGEKYFDGNFN